MKYDGIKLIRISYHAFEQCAERGCSEEEVLKAITECGWQKAKKERLECKMEFPYKQVWNGRYYVNKEVRPIFVNEETEIVVITVYVYYS